ncbi:uncharacterized protein LOC106638709 [Copidosoma floridanum]|uniref:uncharacterized protein LOC106638709 n=1 Tax=Copidosoma floridanum TaxID=29053 RepID=UPI0006C97839|nr:uncharacterized protein LOC106638709 [Copidosoma floridanum]
MRAFASPPVLLFCVTLMVAPRPAVPHLQTCKKTIREVLDHCNSSRGRRDAPALLHDRVLRSLVTASDSTEDSSNPQPQSKTRHSTTIRGMTLSSLPDVPPDETEIHTISLPEANPSEWMELFNEYYGLRTSRKPRAQAQEEFLKTLIPRCCRDQAMCLKNVVTFC